MLSTKINEAEASKIDKLVAQSRVGNRSGLLRSWVELATGGVLRPVEPPPEPVIETSAEAPPVTPKHGPVAIGRSLERSVAGRARWLACLVQQVLAPVAPVKWKAAAPAIARATSDLEAALDGVPVVELVQEYVDELVADLDEPRLRGLAAAVDDALDVVRRRLRQAELDAAGPVTAPVAPTVPCPTCLVRAGSLCVDKDRRPCPVHPDRAAEQNRQLALTPEPPAVVKPANDRAKSGPDRAPKAPTKRKTKAKAEAPPVVEMTQTQYDDIAEAVIAFISDGTATEAEILEACADEDDADDAARFRRVIGDMTRTGGLTLAFGVYSVAPAPEEPNGRLDDASPASADLPGAMGDTAPEVEAVAATRDEEAKAACPLTWGDVLALAKRLKFTPHEGASSPENVWSVVERLRVEISAARTISSIHEAYASSGTDSVDLALLWLVDAKDLVVEGKGAKAIYRRNGAPGETAEEPAAPVATGPFGRRLGRSVGTPSPEMVDAFREGAELRRSEIRTFVITHMAKRDGVEASQLRRSIDDEARRRGWDGPIGEKLAAEALEELIDRGALVLRDNAYWRLDPAVMPCPTCKADAGQLCARMEEGLFHRERIKLAVKQRALPLDSKPAATKGPTGGAWSSSRHEVRCDACGQTWPREPALEVPCPTCLKRAGVWCASPSGHKWMQLHAERIEAARAAGKLHVCPEAQETKTP